MTSWFSRNHSRSSGTLSTEGSRLEAAKARIMARSDAHSVRSRSDEVTELSTALKSQGAQNHFGELLENSMRRAS